MEDAERNEHYAFLRVFMPRYFREAESLAARQGKLVHYTSAQNAVSILTKREVWLRNATTMNDFSEMEYGIGILRLALKSPSGERFKALLEKLQPGLFDSTIGSVDKVLSYIERHTYISCLSMHGHDESPHGRLSMWRAYGGGPSVALVLNNRPFLTPTNALGVNSSPVAYISTDEAPAALVEVCEAMESNWALLAATDDHTRSHYLFQMFTGAILGVKHPGFREEQEWRVYHQPGVYPGEPTTATSSIESVRGVPQRIYKLPLAEPDPKNPIGIEIPDLLDGVIIGPTEYPEAMWDAFVEVLKGTGIAEPSRKVVCSGIPLRENK